MKSLCVMAVSGAAIASRAPQTFLQVAPAIANPPHCHRYPAKATGALINAITAYLSILIFGTSSRAKSIGDRGDHGIVTTLLPMLPKCSYESPPRL